MKQRRNNTISSHMLGSSSGRTLGFHPKNRGFDPRTEYNYYNSEKYGFEAHLSHIKWRGNTRSILDIGVRRSQEGMTYNNYKCCVMQVDNANRFSPCSCISSWVRIPYAVQNYLLNANSNKFCWIIGIHRKIPFLLQSFQEDVVCGKIQVNFISKGISEARYSTWKWTDNSK